MKHHQLSIQQKVGPNRDKHLHTGMGFLVGLFVGASVTGLAVGRLVPLGIVGDAVAGLLVGDGVVSRVGA